eukprot:6119410-Amphidinium_carterae.3
MSQVVSRRPESEGIEFGLDGRTINLKEVQALAGKKEHSARSVLNAACGGLWTDYRMAPV